MASTSVNGVGQDLVITAADRLYQIRVSEKMNTPNSVETEELELTSTPFPENTILDHQRKRQEIETTLNEVRKFERCRTRSQESIENVDSTTLPDLHITRPIYMETAKDRYKKQGLGRWNQVVTLRNSRSSPSQMSSASTRLNSDVQLRCYCREPDSGTEPMVKCNNEWCPIGWFHARCAGCQDEDSEYEHFLCDYCREDYGPFGPVSEDEVMMEEVTAVNDMILEQADNLAIEDDDMEALYSADDESDQDNDSAQTSTAVHWGTPINIRSQPTTIHPIPANHNIHPSTEDSTTQPEQLDGKSLTRNSSISAFTSSSSTTCHPISFHDPLARSLFPGSSKTSFADLAPFMTSESLSPREVEVFENWKHSQSPSRLVRALLSSSSSNNDNRDDSNHGDDANSVRSPSAHCEIREANEDEKGRFPKDDSDCGGNGGSQEERLSQLLKELSS